MADKGKFKSYLDDEKQYTNFLAFFQREIEKRGVGEVLNEHVFAGDEHADDMLVRVFAGWFIPSFFRWVYLLTILFLLKVSSTL